MSIEYYKGKFTEIPEWLFSKKVTNQKMSRFKYCLGITSIPENLFKHNTNATIFRDVFVGCTGITNIPENLFKYNEKAKDFDYAFSGCLGITSIPENLFKYNTKATRFGYTFGGCYGLTSVPDKIIEKLKKAKEDGGYVQATFSGCTNALNYNTLPAYMKDW